MMGDPPRRFLKRSHAPDLRAGRALRLSRPLRHESHDGRPPRGVPQRDRGAVLDLVSQIIQSASREAPLGRSIRSRGFLALDRAAMLCELGAREIHEGAHTRRAAKIGMGQHP